jgi:hypothetical protein
MSSDARLFGIMILAEQNLTLQGMVAVETATALYMKEIHATKRIVGGFPGARCTRWRNRTWGCRDWGPNLKVGQASETQTKVGHGFTRDSSG